MLDVLLTGAAFEFAARIKKKVKQIEDKAQTHTHTLRQGREGELDIEEEERWIFVCG